MARGLELEVVEAKVPEAQLGRRQVELPHPGEAFVIQRHHLVAPGGKPLAPLGQRARIVQPEDFHVSGVKTGFLHFRHHLRQGRGIAARKDVLADPRAGRARSVGTADRMQQEDAVPLQQTAHLGEHLAIVAHAHVLEHAHRDDPVEFAVQFTVVLEQELHLVLKPASCRAFVRQPVLFFRQGDAGDLCARHLRQVKPQPAPSRSDVEHLHAWLDHQLGRQMPLLGKLG